MLTAKTERDKYRRMWERPEYRERSPALGHVLAAFNRFGQPEHGTVRDYGCGVPVAVDYFRERGLTAEGVDIVALRDDVIEATLWDLPPSLAPTDFSFCTDVLEHLPPERVAAAIAGIRARTRRVAYFTIATNRCELGLLIGEELHLTIRSLAWWVEMFAEHCGGEIGYEHGDHSWRHVFVARMPQ